MVAKLSNKASVTVRNEVNLDAKRFAEYDLDGNQSLDFEEFLAMMPTRVREENSSEDIKKWFTLADTDGSGEISVNEFFMVRVPTCQPACAIMSLVSS